MVPMGTWARSGRAITVALTEGREGAVKHDDAPQATIRVVLHDIKTVRDGIPLGINGVPCFVISGRHAIAGAQEPEVIERLLDVATVEATEL